MKRTMLQEDDEPSASPGRRRAAGDVAATLIASVAIALPLVFYLHQHVEILRLGYEIESLKERRVELAERALELRIERTQSASLQRVEDQATLLGLCAPEPTNVYVAKGAVAPRGGATETEEKRP